MTQIAGIKNVIARAWGTLSVGYQITRSADNKVLIDAWG